MGMIEVVLFGFKFGVVHCLTGLGTGWSERLLLFRGGL